MTDGRKKRFASRPTGPRSTVRGCVGGFAGAGRDIGRLGHLGRPRRVRCIQPAPGACRRGERPAPAVGPGAIPRVHDVRGLRRADRPGRVFLRRGLFHQPRVVGRDACAHGGRGSCLDRRRGRPGDAEPRRERAEPGARTSAASGRRGQRPQDTAACLGGARHPHALVPHRHDREYHAQPGRCCAAGGGAGAASLAQYALPGRPGFRPGRHFLARRRPNPASEQRVPSERFALAGRRTPGAARPGKKRVAHDRSA
jgi:hypothetical protein